jgi:hypothetical protein
MSDLNPAFRFVLTVFATWRVTHLLAEEDGPGDVLYRLRRRLGSSVLGRLMDCFFCLSLWVAAPLACVVTLRPADWALTWLALSGAACVLQRVLPENRPSVVIREFPEEGAFDDAMLWPEEERSADGAGAAHDR